MPSSLIPEIVCVEPHENEYKLIKKILLDKFKIKLLHFKQSEDALNYIATHEVALLLTRGVVSPLSGLELVRAIKSSHAKKTKVLFMSIMKDGSETAFAYGADAFINVPIDPDELIEKVGELLRES